jgi:hypothetical protein
MVKLKVIVFLSYYFYITRIDIFLSLNMSNVFINTFVRYNYNKSIHDCSESPVKITL